MSYTHYWTFDKKRNGKAAQSEKAYQKAILECAKIIRYYSETFGGLSGYTAHSKPYQYGGINTNGSKQDGHETFALREHLNQNEAFNFCKTAQKPYDTVVVACLIVLRHRLGDLVDVSSDGRASDWRDGLILAQRVLGLKTLQIPVSIQNKAA